MSGIATTRTLHTPEERNAIHKTPSWIWPLAIIEGANPRILANPTSARGDGIILIGYQDEISSRNPIPVLAAQGGVVTYAVQATNGATLCLDHPGGWSTQYEGMKSLSVLATDRFRHRRKVRVAAGAVLGHIWRSPPCLHFAVARLADNGLIRVDPIRYMDGWSVLRWPESAPSVRKRQAG